MTWKLSIHLVRNRYEHDPRREEINPAEIAALGAFLTALSAMVRDTPPEPNADEPLSDPVQDVEVVAADIGSVRVHCYWRWVVERSNR